MIQYLPKLPGTYSRKQSFRHTWVKLSSCVKPSGSLVTKEKSFLSIIYSMMDYFNREQTLQVICSTCSIGKATAVQKEHFHCLRSLKLKQSQKQYIRSLQERMYIVYNQHLVIVMQASDTNNTGCAADEKRSTYFPKGLTLASSMVRYLRVLRLSGSSRIPKVQQQ